VILAQCRWPVEQAQLDLSAVLQESVKPYLHGVNEFIFVYLMYKQQVKFHILEPPTLLSSHGSTLTSVRLQPCSPQWWHLELQE